MTTFTLHVHSFVDLITNSSSELFAAANDRTLETVRAIINATLKAGGSTKCCDDLVLLKLVPGDPFDEGTTTNVVCVAKAEGTEEMAQLITGLKDSFGEERVQC